MTRRLARHWKPISTPVGNTAAILLVLPLPSCRRSAILAERGSLFAYGHSQFLRAKTESLFTTGDDCPDMPEKDWPASPLGRVYLRSGSRIYRTVVRLTGVSPIPENTRRQLVQLGAKVGLSASEVNAALAKPAVPKRRSLPRWAIWVLLLGAFAISLVVTAAWVTFVPSPTYPPGARYGALGPRDFGD